MRLTQKVKKILAHYEGENPGVKQNLARFLMSGKLAGTGKMVLLAVDQGFEHGPRAFVMNPAAFDPHYHYRFAVEAGVSGYAAPLAALEAGSETYLGAVPTILKINSSNSLLSKDHFPDQAVTASISDALRLGCSAIGFTIYPGSDQSLEMMEELRDLAAEARACGLAVIVWSYARGSMSKVGETALDVIAYGAHMACLLGAHIVKVKLPSDSVEMPAATALYQQHVNGKTMADRVAHVVQSCFNGRRMVVFSGGDTKEASEVIADARSIHQGGGFGAIIGRNCFQRPAVEAKLMLENIVTEFKKPL